MYRTTLVEVPRERSLADYRRAGVPILDQGEEGACTGFGLAAVVHYLLRTRRPSGEPAAQRGERGFNRVAVSPHMLYRMARRYDEWSGEKDDGSSARGAMKGWHKHGVCALQQWKSAGAGTSDTLLTSERSMDALSRPLGGYFRVNHQDVVAMHAALAEVGVLFATSWVHRGWDEVKADGRIHIRSGNDGGHAFAIVAWNQTGFWIQNSWGPRWGKLGFAHVTYDDWLENGTDVWVARLGSPVGLAARVELESTSSRSTSGVRSPRALSELRPHVVSLGNEGRLRPAGAFGTDAQAVSGIFSKDIPQITANWKRKRLLLYAHGGLVAEEGALQRVQDYRQAFLPAQVYPLAFVWKSDYWTTIKNALEDAQNKRKPEGFLDKTRDFLLNRLDDTLEPIARFGTGKLEWDEMKENAERATTTPDGGARLVAKHVAALARQGFEIHIAAHSAGAILMAHLVRLLTATGAIDEGPLFGSTGHGIEIRSCSLWGPACTIDLFRANYLPAVDSGKLRQFNLFTLTDKAEQDDHCANIYHKSLLYLVSHAFEKRMRNPLLPVGQDAKAAGEPILGMEWWLSRDRALSSRFKTPEPGGRDADRAGPLVWIKSPNLYPEGSCLASAARAHGAFDDDVCTVKATLARILGRTVLPAQTEVCFERTDQSNRDRREQIMRTTRSN
jgi:hypothetical protein